LILALGIAAVLVGGCAAVELVRPQRYTWAWTGTDAAGQGRLQAAHTECVPEVNEPYIPLLWGGGYAIQETLYKDCMEKHGFTKVKTEYLSGMKPAGLREACNRLEEQTCFVRARVGWSIQAPEPVLPGNLAECFKDGEPIPGSSCFPKAQPAPTK